MPTTSNFSVRFASIDPSKVRNRLVRNPAYNTNKVSLNNWCYVELRASRKPALQESLRLDIEKNGLRNPILVYALPEGTFLTFGGSRLRIAQEIGLDSIPAIVNDYTGKYRYDPEVNPDNWPKYFTDIPSWHEFGEFGFDYHYNLERARRDNADSAGFAWLKGKDTGTKERILKEMPWAADLMPKD